MNFFSSLYFLIIAPSILLIIGSSNSIYKKLFSKILVLFILPLYLLGMYRSSGVDISGYKRLYEVSATDLFDPGFLLLINMSKAISLSFELFLLSLGVLTAILYFRVSRFFSIKYGILIFVLMLHLFIVRDYSQLRLGLACAMIIYSYTLNGKLKYLGYFFGFSIHFTGLVLISLFTYFELILKKKPSLIKKIFPFIVIFLFGFFINYLGALDPRIDLYLNWDKSGYGVPVNDYKQPLFIFFIVLFHLYFNKKTISDFDLFTFCYLSSLMIFVSFSDYAIFSYRLSNVAISLYPITIAKMFECSRPNLNKICGILIFIILVGLRDNSLQILNSIEIG
jgi:hypothetical protein